VDGYFQQVRHRLDDDRAAAYDALLAAEAKATAEKKGVHSAKVRVSNPLGSPLCSVACTADGFEID